MTYLFAVVAVVGFIFTLKRRSFISKNMSLKLPAVTFIFYSVFSIPVILNFEISIHGFYGMVYGILNSPLNLIFDTDQIANSLFSEPSLASSNIVFAISSIVFWLFVSIVVGVSLDLKRKLRKSAL